MGRLHALSDASEVAKRRKLVPPGPKGKGAAELYNLADDLEEKQNLDAKHPETLKELAQLKDQGILTEEEFAAQKAKILG